MDIRTPPWNFSDAIVALTLAGAIAIQAFSGAGSAEPATPPGFVSLLAGTSLLPALVVLLCLHRCVRDGLSPSALLGADGAGSGVVGRWIASGMLAGLVLAVLCGFLASFLQSALERLGVPASPQDSVQWLLAPETPWRTKVLLSVHATAVAPVCEEILYRGAILSGALRRLPRHRSAVVLAVSVLFGLAHGSLVALLPLALVGAVCAGFVLRTGSLLPGMALHIAFNAANLALVRLAG